MKLSILHEEDNLGSEKEEGTPTQKAIQDAGGIKTIRDKTGISAPMMSHLKKPPKDKDHRNPSAKTLKKMKQAGVNINAVLNNVG